MAGDGGQTRRIALWTLLCILSLALLLASPLALGLFTRIVDQNWSDVGNLGQAYGAASTILSALAVVGVAASLQMQVRQNHLSQAYGVRDQQLTLMQLLLSDPTLLPASVTADGIPHERWRQLIYINLMFKHLQLGYEVGYISQESLRLHVSQYFTIEFIREWWKDTGWMYHLDANSPKRKGFLAIVDSAFAEAS